MSQHGGASGPSPPNNKQFTEAMSLISLTNICFKNCVMKNKPRQLQENPDQSKEELLQSKAKIQGVLDYLGVEGHTSEEWVLSEKETVCLHNCGKSYVELKGFLHEQLLKDYTYIRKKNRALFEGM
ncbi:hypothetical protein FGO68_gene16045 [Halteria grandinella]|uniref:Uncharacterized protein n=1 Tax=Halteria grandinella TaxID=5974 RepID=A0A8J8T2E7_HALGN|nr:hypothetical protein FGO68_gene16045 [Halteria grandinella]